MSDGTMRAYSTTGKRGKMAAMFRSRSVANDCSARTLNAGSDVMDNSGYYSGSFQALINPQA